MAVRPGYKQTEVGVIPVDWDAVEMEKISVNIGDGLHGTPIYSSNGGYFFVNGNNLSGGKVVATSDTKSVDYSEFIKHRKPLSNRSILLSINGTIGNLALYDGEQIVLGKSAAYLNVRPEVCKHFIYHALQTDIVRRQFFDGLTGSTIGNLGLATIRKTQLPLPSTVAEQRAIAAALSDVDALLAKLDQLIAKKRDLKQAAMQQLLTGQTRLPGFSGEWEVMLLGDLCMTYSGGTPPTSIREYYGGDIPWITSSDLNQGYIESVEGRITQSGLENSSAKMVNAGSLLIALYGATSGVTAITRVRAAINQAVLAIIPKISDARFIYQYLRFRKDWVISTFTQGGQPNLSGDIVKSLPIPVPSEAEQRTIIAVLSDMDAELTALEARRDKTRALKQGMMQELLTGRIRLV